MHRYIFPSLLSVLRVFFLLGPFLLFGALAVNFALEPTTDPATVVKSSSLIETLTKVFYFLAFSFMADILWVLVSFIRSGWLMTWLPTALSATAYWYFMKSICHWPSAQFRFRLQWILINCLACSVISAVVFAADGAILSKFRFGSMRGDVNTELFWIKVVGVIGFVIGAFIAFISKRRNDSEHDNRPE